MPKSKFTPIILDTLDEGPASLRTLKEKCGKDKNIRKSLHRLLKEGIIEIEGYDDTCESFKESCMMFKKVNDGYENPIYIKSLLDNPLEDNNYSKIRKIFKTRIKKVNKIYNEEIKRLKEIQGQMSLKEAIEKEFVNPNKIYKKIRRDENLIKKTFNDVLKEDPNAQIFFLKKQFQTEIGNLYKSKSEYPYFSNKVKFKGNNLMNYVESYEFHLSYLPISDFWEQVLFNHLVIDSFKKTSDDKENSLWDLAITLTEPLNLFVEKLEIIESIGEYLIDKEMDRAIHW